MIPSQSRQTVRLTLSDSHVAGGRIGAEYLRNWTATALARVHIHLKPESNSPFERVTQGRKSQTTGTSCPDDDVDVANTLEFGPGIHLLIAAVM